TGPGRNNGRNARFVSGDRFDLHCRRGDACARSPHLSIDVPLKTTEVESREVHVVKAPERAHSQIAVRRYGRLRRLRSYFILDPPIWLYTGVLGLLATLVSLFGNRERVLHSFARAWSWAIMKTIFSPVKVTGLDQIDTTKPLVYAVTHASAL